MAHFPASLEEETRQRSLSRKKEITGIKNIEEYYVELTKIVEEEMYNDYGHYQSLCRAAENKDWHVVKKLIENYPEALTARLSEYTGTILHHVARSDNIQLVQYVVERMDLSALEFTDVMSETALSYSACAGTTKAAEIMVQRNPKLPNIPNCWDHLPLHTAAQFGHEEMVRFLLQVTAKDEDQSPFKGESGVVLVEYLITSGFYGIALELLKQNPKLAREQLNDRKRILEKLARKPRAFASGSQLGFWQHLIYKCIPDDSSLTDIRGGYVEDPEKNSKECFTKCTQFGFLQRSFATGSMYKKLYVVLYNLIKRLVPGIKSIHDRKLMHKQTCELVKLICEGVTCNFNEALNSLKSPILTAARLGIQEIVIEIIKVYSLSSFAFLDDDGHNIYQIAVLRRQEQVLGLLHTMDFDKKWITYFPDKLNNNFLHLAGGLVPSSRVAGAALQMQRELQWFKAVESFVHPSLQEELNSDNLTPREVFTKAHTKLVKAGQAWIKDTATSCSVVAALIITMTFAAAITVPGANDSNGKPNYLNEKSFLIFAMSNALALFFSSTSVLTFLGILTSRYSEEDFLESLPRKVLMGLITLFFSIAAMMIAFAATINLLVFHPLRWNISSIFLLACLPVTLFALLQFPLLVEIIRSTYGPSFI